MYKKILVFFSLLLILTGITSGQKETQIIDSLRERLAYYQSIDSNSYHVSNTLLLLELETQITDPYQCLEYGKLAIKIAEKRGDKNSLAGHCNVMGHVYISMKQYYTAMQYFFRGYKTMVEFGKEDSTGYYLVDIGNGFFADNNNDLPVKYYRKAAQVFNKVHNDYGVAVAFNNIGLVKNRIEEQDSALFYFNLALSFRQKLNDSFLIAHSYRYIGDTYKKKKKYDTALVYLKHGLSIIIKSDRKIYDQKRFYEEIYQSIAEVYELEQNYKQAIVYYKLSLQAINDDLKNKFSQTMVMQKIASCYIQLNQYLLAQYYALDALKIAEELNSLNDKRNCHLILIQIYTNTNNNQKLFTHLKLFSQLTDSLLKDQSDEKFTGLRIQVESYQKEKELAYQNVLLASEKAKLKNRAIIRNMLIIGFVLLVLLVIALFIAFRRKQSINKILSEKNIQISQQKEELELTSSFKQQFLANMSHEIRTPMTGIIGMIDFLEKTKLDEKQKEYIEIIRNSSEVLLMIINDILDLSKIEAGKMELKPIVFSVDALVRKTQLLFTSLCKKEDLLIEFKCDDELPDFIKADELRIMEIITNLISNAIKFTEKGVITIEIKLIWIENDNIKIKIEVKDTGIGIGKEDQEQLFKVFSQIDSAPTLKYKGSGLGLSICKKLAELMGGEINMESDGVNGSNFWFTFFAKTVSKNPIKQIIQDEKNELSRSLNISVLLVEDKLVNQKVIELMLNYLGCKTTIVSNGMEALDKVDKYIFDIILMDIQMPVMDGITTVKELRKRHHTLPPIIAISANVIEGYKNKYISEGMDDCIAKPIKSDELARIITKWSKIAK